MIRTTMAMAAVGGAMLMTAGTMAPAEAAIKCKDGTQWNSAANAWISSPYCEDKLIAQVSGYSFQAIRTRPSVKQEACRFAGSNIRINHLCSDHLYEGNNRLR